MIKNQPKQKNAASNAQDQESGRKKQESSNQPNLKVPKNSTFNIQTSKGRKPMLSRGGSHPLPKPRKSQRNQTNPQSLKAASPQKSLQPRLGKVSQQTASVARTSNQKSKGSTTSKELIQERLKKKSPWFDSIMSPISGGGVKIPDPIGTDTGTYQHVENVSVKVNAGGIVGLRVVCPYINSYTGLTSITNGLNYQITGSSGTESSANWSDGSNASKSGFSFKQIPPLMKANARAHRVVSACVLAQSEVATLQDQGELTAFVTPFSINSRNVAYATYQFQYDSTLLPVNKHQPIVARWYPVSSESNVFDGDSFVQDSDLICSYDDFLDPNDAAHNGTSGVIPWEFGVMGAGMQVGAIVRFQIVVNYEFIPLMSTAMVAAESSPVDEVETDLVAKWVSDAPVTEVVSQKFASQAQNSSRVAEESEPSGFGMLFNVIEEALPLIMKII